MEQVNHTIKYIIKTDSDKTYSLYIMEPKEIQKHKFIALFLFYDDVDINDTEKLWLNLRHRILFENSIEDIKQKVIEYTSGRNEKLFFLELQDTMIVK
jgi:hypothetical protein